MGASGAVSAAVVLFIFMYPRETILLMGILPMPAWVLGVLLLGGNILTALNPTSAIAWEAHFVGAAFGYLYFKLQGSFARFHWDGSAKWKRSRTKLKLHDPDTIDQKLQLDADKILAKISEQGEESLVISTPAPATGVCFGRFGGSSQGPKPPHSAWERAHPKQWWRERRWRHASPPRQAVPCA